MKNVKKTLNKAFTLIELVVVMAVIAILAGVSVGVYFGVINNANQSAVDQEAAQAEQAILVATTGNGYEGSIEGTKLNKAVMKNSSELELTFSESVTSDSNSTTDEVDKALEGLYLISLSDDGTVDWDNDYTFNAVVPSEGTTETTITVTSFTFENGNGKTAVITFGD